MTTDTVGRCSCCDQPIQRGQERTVTIESGTSARPDVLIHRTACLPGATPPPDTLVTAGCTRCADLETRAQDPQLHDVKGATLYVWIQHLIDVHGVTAGPQPECPTCYQWLSARGISPRLAAAWRLHHYVSHLVTGRLPARQ